MEIVTVDRLFRVTKLVTLGERSLTVRCLSGPEKQERERAALLAGLALEKKLRNPESDDYQLRLAGYEQLDEAALKGILQANYLRTAQARAEDELPPVYLPFPENATEDEKRGVLEAREQAESARKEKVAQRVQKLNEEYAKTLEDRSKDWLLVEVRKQAIAVAISNETNEEYVYYGLYLGVSNADGSRYFASADEARKMPDAITRKLADEMLEVDRIDPLALNGQSSTG